MRIVSTLAIAAILVSGMKAKNEDPQYSVRTFPLQDTLLPGMDNELEILFDGQPADLSFIAVNAKNLDYVKKGGAFFIATCEASDQPQEAKIQLVQQGKTLLEKGFVIPVMTPGLKARAEAMVNMKQKHVFEVRVFPFADTLVTGIENELQVLMDGQAAKDISVTISGGSMTMSDEEGKYLVRTHASAIGKKAVFRVTHEQKIVKEITFTVVAFNGDLVTRYKRLSDERERGKK